MAIESQVKAEREMESRLVSMAIRKQQESMSQVEIVSICLVTC